MSVLETIPALGAVTLHVSKELKLSFTVSFNRSLNSNVLGISSWSNHYSSYIYQESATG
jgi:hypothetical protein